MRNSFMTIPRNRGKPRRFLWPSRAGPPLAFYRRTGPPESADTIPRLMRPPNTAKTVPKRLLWLSRAGPPGAVRQGGAPTGPPPRDGPSSTYESHNFDLKGCNTMKTTKRILAVVLAVMMLAAMMCTTALAATEKYSISINNQIAGHTYEAYQIFSGVLSPGGVLSNVEWGADITAEGVTAMGDAGTKASSITDKVAAAVFAESLLPYLDEAPSGTTSTLENITVVGQTVQGYKITGLEAGYYLIRDKSNTLDGTDEAHTSLILKVVDNVTVTPKSSKTTVTKKVFDPVNFKGDTTPGWVDATDAKAGDILKFRLTATLPNDYSVFDHYELIFHDQMAAGLKTPDSVTVAVDGTTIDSGYSLVANPGCEHNCTFHVVFADLKSINTVGNNSVITVEYGAELQDTAVTGQTGNKNTVKLEYCNNPYATTAEDETTGITTGDTVIVFTYKLNLNKYDHSTNPLPGASFKIEKYDEVNGTWDWDDITDTLVMNDDKASFYIGSLDEGIYRVTETTTPVGYNTIEPFYFKVVADYSVNSDTPTLNSLTIKQCAENGSDLGSDELNPLVSTIHDNLADGILTLRVANRGGAQLPETGGIGTTIFYVAGVVLVLGAVAVLAVKKRGNA